MGCISTPNFAKKQHLLYFNTRYTATSPLYDICFFVWEKIPRVFCRFSSQGTALEQQKEPEGFPRFLPAADCNPWMKPAGEGSDFRRFFLVNVFFCRKARIIFGADLNLLLFFLWWIDGGYIIIYSSWKKRVEVVMDWHGMKGELWFLKRRDWPTILSKAWTSTSSFPFIYNMIRCGCSIPNGGSLFITPSVLPMYDQYP